MAHRYTDGIRTAATAATANNFGGALWNPHASVRLRVYEVHFFKTVATVDNPALSRISARGTATLTSTPDITNDHEHRLAPLSGALVDGTYSAQPTVIGTSFLHRSNLPAAVASGLMWVFPVPLEIAAGQGLGLMTVQAVILQPGDLTFIWEEN